MFKKSAILFCLILFLGIVNGQNKEIKKQIKELLKKAQLDFDGDDNLKAWSFYKQVLLLDPKNEKAGVNGAISFFKLNYVIDGYRHIPLKGPNIESNLKFGFQH